MRTGAAISVVVHVAAMTALLVLAGVRPFDPTAAEAITVELVTPDEAPPPKEPDPTYDFPTLSDKDQQKAPAEAAPQEQAPKDQAQPTPPPEPPQNTAAKSKPDTRQAALQQKAAEQQKPVAPSQPVAQPQPAEQAQPAVPTAAPDITAKYGTMFAMPNSNTGDFDAKATATANISVKDAAALREHLKTCSILPSSVTPADNVRVVLRVSLRPDGRLAKEPLLIEASASEKGPALMRSAMDALAKCQPYAMLPPESYNEWRMLDLSFTPKDFKGG